MNRETPTWQPVSALPTLASLIDDIGADTGAQRETFQSVKTEPDVLDSALIERIERVYSEQVDICDLLEEQLSRWRQGPLSSEQSNEIARLESQVATLRANLTNVLDLVGEVKDHTIDKTWRRTNWRSVSSFFRKNTGSEKSHDDDQL